YNFRLELTCPTGPPTHPSRTALSVCLTRSSALFLSDLRSATSLSLAYFLSSKYPFAPSCPLLPPLCVACSLHSLHSAACMPALLPARVASAWPKYFVVPLLCCDPASASSGPLPLTSCSRHQPP
ncbi:hypothetical protein S245_034091, partial [Arachis hypogaea]